MFISQNLPFMKKQLSLFAFGAMMITTAWMSPVVSSETKEQKVSVSSKPFSSEFSFFRLHRQGKNGATATWGVNSSAGISGFFVEKTYEDPSDPYAFWETVSSMPCTGGKSYKCTDTNVLPGNITFRVVAQLSTGGTVMSNIETINIVGH